MHQFTKANAAENGRKGGLLRWKLYREQQEAEKKAASLPPQAVSERDNRVQKQIEKIDEMLLSSKSVDEIAKLTKAKERLWRLLWPSGKSSKGGNGSRRPAPTFANAPQEQR